jgi:hypothetical protein
MKRTFTLLCTVLLFTASSQAQLVVNSLSTTSSLVSSLVDNSVSITNIQEDCRQNGLNIARGSFTFLGSNLSISQGIMLTTGNALLARGPNNITGAGLGSLSLGGGASADTDLQNIVGISNLFDLCKIEFDLIPAYDTLSITYVFGSEEYPEYAPPLDNGGTFNDVFGFFLSGPGYAGAVNFAVLPNGDRVSVSNINAVKNPAYLVDNTNGANLQYDGLTRELTAKIKVTPLQTHHIKLAIADVGDSYYDSGVFIKAGSIMTGTVVPVELLSFSGKALGAHNMVEWATATELNVSHFEVQRSSEGVNFTGLGHQEGKGSGSHYSFRDESPLPGVNYYRIKETDHDGKTTFSGVIDVRNPAVAVSPEITKIFPNPATQTVNTVVKLPSGSRISWELVDVAGKVVSGNELTLPGGSNVVSMDVAGLQKGVYFLRMYSDTWCSAYHRVIR